MRNRATADRGESPGISVVPDPGPADRAPGELTAAEAFDAIFWPAYPRKIAKHEARREWLRIGMADDDQATLDHIMRGLTHYIENEWAQDRDGWLRFVPHAATWLHQRRYEDVE